MKIRFAGAHFRLSLEWFRHNIGKAKWPERKTGERILSFHSPQFPLTCRNLPFSCLGFFSSVEIKNKFIAHRISTTVKKVRKPTSTSEIEKKLTFLHIYDAIKSYHQWFLFFLNSNLKMDCFTSIWNLD